MKICIYEDKGYKRFGSLVDTRAVWDLRCGALTIAEKLMLQLRSPLPYFHVRRSLSALYRERMTGESRINPKLDGETVLFINGRIILDEITSDFLTNDNSPCAYVSENTLVAFRLSKEKLGEISLDDEDYITPGIISGLPVREVSVTEIKYPWDILSLNVTQISSDLELAQRIFPAVKTETPSDVITRGSENILSPGKVTIGAGVIMDAEENIIRFENDVNIKSGAILEAGDGSIWIAESVVIEAGAIIKGPAYIGPKSIVRSEARLSDGVSLGPQCRVGGEISSVIMQGFSNKQHSGYLGNSYLGSWVNLGAATDNSDLKNNYRPISVMLHGEEIDTGSLHIGVFLADFTRTAIHTRLNSGTIVGVCCNLFGNNFPTKDIPAFTWFGEGGYSIYKPEKALETIRVVMDRRGMELTPAMETLLRNIFEATAGQRHNLMH